MARKLATKPSKVLRIGLKRLEITHAIRGDRHPGWGESVILKDGKKGQLVCAEGAITNGTSFTYSEAQVAAMNYLKGAIFDTAQENAEIQARSFRLATGYKVVTVEEYFATGIQFGLDKKRDLDWRDVSIPLWHDSILTPDEMKHCFKLAIQRAEMDESEAQLEKKGL